ncbi:MAG: hypothetical protein ACYDH9_17680 [Limisphaerales bacterium]
MHPPDPTGMCKRTTRVSEVALLALLLSLSLSAPEPALGAATNARLATTTISAPQPDRLSVAVIGFANETGDTTESFWRPGIQRLMISALREAKAVRVMPDDAVTFALRQLNKKSSDPVQALEGRKLGELIEARASSGGSTDGRASNGRSVRGC